MRDLTRREMLAWSAAGLASSLYAPGGSAQEPAEKPASQWASFRNGPRLLGIAGTDLPDKLKEVWSIDAPDGVSATAAIIDGRAYLADLSGNLRAVDLKTGKVHWTYTSLEEIPKNSFLPGFKASPTVGETAIYIGDEDGFFHSVDRATGKRQWTFETGAEIISSATLDGDRVLFGSYDNTLYCLNRATGEQLWKVVTEGYVHCTPAVTEGTTFIAGCDEHLRGIEIATGKEVLNLPVNTYLIASPATRDGILYFGTYAATVLAIDWKNKKTVWTYSAQRDLPFQSSAAVTDELVVVGGRDKNIHAIDRRTGKGVWVTPTRARVDSSPVICGNRLFVGSSDRTLYELDLASGKEVAKYPIGAAVTASPAIGEGHLIIGGEGNNSRFICLGAG